MDLAARKAMHRLHDDLDDDNDGNVSLSEGADVCCLAHSYDKKFVFGFELHFNGN